MLRVSEDNGLDVDFVRLVVPDALLELVRVGTDLACLELCSFDEETELLEPRAEDLSLDLPFAYREKVTRRNTVTTTNHFFLLCAYMTIPFLRLLLRIHLLHGS